MQNAAILKVRRGTLKVSSVKPGGGDVILQVCPEGKPSTTLTLNSHQAEGLAFELRAFAHGDTGTLFCEVYHP